MSNATRAILMFASFLAVLVGDSWWMAWNGGYPFGRSLASVIGTYVAILLAYACYRRARSESSCGESQANAAAGSRALIGRKAETLAGITLPVVIENSQVVP